MSVIRPDGAPSIEREPVCVEIARLQLTLQEAARMCCERHGLIPMITNDLNIMRISAAKGKADAACVHRHSSPVHP
jgi:hypothetical protein